MRAINLCLAVICAAHVTTTFAHPGSAIAVDRAGLVYFVDTGSGVYRLGAPGTLTRIPGPAFHWFAMDEADRFAGTRLPAAAGWELQRAGSSPTLILSSDYPVTIGADGHLYYPVPRPGGGGVQLMHLEPSGASSVFARLPEQTTGRPLLWLNGLTTGPDGSFYYTEDAAIRRVTREGRVSSVASGIAPPKCAAVPLDEPAGPRLRGLAVDSGGTVYVAASGCASLLKVTPAGQVSVLLQLEPPWSPTAVAVSGSDLYVLEYLHTPGDDRVRWTPRIRRLSQDGKSEIVARIDR
jgi:streptogramin lyase